MKKGKGTREITTYAIANDFASIYTQGSVSNCKLEYMDYATYLVSALRNYEKNEKEIKEMFGALRGSIFLSIKEDGALELIKKHFEVYYANRVPTHYNNEKMYHVCIRNPWSKVTSKEYIRPVIKSDLVLKDKQETLDILSRLKKDLVKNRRKTDIIDLYIKDLS